MPPVLGAVGAITVLCGGWTIGALRTSGPRWTAAVVVFALALGGLAAVSTQVRRPVSTTAVVAEILSLIGIAALFGAPSPAPVRVFLAVAAIVMLAWLTVTTLVWAEPLQARSGSRV